jgi:hypothetical protein
MAPGSSKLLTEMSTSNLSGVMGGRRVRLTILPPSVSHCLDNMGVPKSHNAMGVHGLLQGELSLFMFVPNM